MQDGNGFCGETLVDLWLLWQWFWRWGLCNTRVMEVYLDYAVQWKTRSKTSNKIMNKGVGKLQYYLRFGYDLNENNN